MSPLMNATHATLILLAVLLAAPAPAQDTSNASEQPRPRRGYDPEKVHDPSTVLEQDGVYRFFSTGGGVSLMREQPDGRWLREARLFERNKLPAWHQERVPGNRGHLWAPDVIKLGGRYLVYYSVSTFGKNTSAIGLATGKTLDPKSPDWAWKDEGTVITSSRSDRFNAIDPAIFFDKDGRLYMSFGSFWDGIFIVELDPATGLRLHPKKAPTKLAFAPEIEAPFLTHAPDGKYVLFVNWGRCCRGKDSTYEIRVGRSDKPTGPFRRSRRQGSARAGRHANPRDGRSPHRPRPRLDPQSAEGKEFLVHHFYDGENRGRSRARMLLLTWDDAGWPVVRGLAKGE